MTPHYEWTPASDPPDTNRCVIARTISTNRAPYEALCYYYWGKFWVPGEVTYWRDVESPKEFFNHTTEPPKESAE